MEKSHISGLRSAKAHFNEAAFRIGGWAAWTPELETETAWRAWAGFRQTATPERIVDGSVPPAILRRRISPLGQAVLRAAWKLPMISTSRIISASRHGEFGRTLSILESLANANSVSPADFTLSVHHALIGLLSIAAGNREGHTAIAAGRESFGYALMEAVACLSEDPETPIILLYYDEPLPAPMTGFGAPDEQPIAMAFSMTANGDGERFTLATSPATGRQAPRQGALQALEFLRFVLTDEAESVSFGERLDWRWTRHASAA